MRTTNDHDDHSETSTIADGAEETSVVNVDDLLNMTSQSNCCISTTQTIKGV